MILGALAAFLAVLLAWPSPRGRPMAQRGGRPGPAQDIPPTVEQAASALVLLAAALRGGAGPIECLEAVARIDEGAGHDLAVVAAAHRWGESSQEAWRHVGPGWEPAAVAWHTAMSAGAAPAALVEEAAARMGLAESRRLEAAVHRAGVMLVLPLGTCFLPGFIATTVAPVVWLLLSELA